MSPSVPRAASVTLVLIASVILSSSSPLPTATVLPSLPRAGEDWARTCRSKLRAHGYTWVKDVAEESLFVRLLGHLALDSIGRGMGPCQTQRWSVHLAPDFLTFWSPSLAY